MRELTFIKVAESMGIPIYAEDGGFVSFFNSPYYSHMNFSAVDIYLGGKKFGEPAYSPAEGIVTLTRPFTPPNPKYFEGSSKDWITCIECSSNPTLWVRILHLKPTVNVGDKIRVGDVLGNYLRTGHFDFWTGPHIHVEVREPNNILRAKGAYPLKPVNNPSSVDLGLGAINEENPIEPSTIEEDYILAKPRLGLWRVGNFWGLGCRVGGSFGVLDGGIPHYGYGGVHLTSTEGLCEGSPVMVGELKVGVVDKVFLNAARFRCLPIQVSFGEQRMKGLSLYLNLNRQGKLKVVPYKPGRIGREHLPSRVEIWGVDI
ncbi:MAG: M23 family metallopeptidase [Candidatus Bathyarchaeia archaeon]